MTGPPSSSTASVAGGTTSTHHSGPSGTVHPSPNNVNVGIAENPIDLTQELVVLGQCLSHRAASTSRNPGMVSIGFIDMTVDE